MSLSIVYSRAVFGVNAPLVTVEVHLSNGLPKFHIVGLPEAAVKESRDRVRSAIINSGFDFAARRITVNLGPADLPKEGGRYDLPIAVGILAASGQIPSDQLKQYEFAGELALSGALCPVKGMLPFALGTRSAKRSLILPLANVDESALCGEGIDIFPALHLNGVCSHLCHREMISPHLLPQSRGEMKDENAINLRDIHGQPHARRALEVAAAGGHSLLMIGVPGTGKTMLASRLATILPSLSHEEAIESAAIASISSQGFEVSQWQQRPFRSPHHTTSVVALVGGGKPLRPGEISLAHNGVLFLDELPEFNRHVLESLREPLESGSITISRAACQAEFPARFQLIAAMNPCPCGYSGDPHGRCQCTKESIKRYRSKLSGPLLDRIDMHVEVPALPQGVLAHANITKNEDSATVRARVFIARQQQLTRQSQLNHLLTGKKLEKVGNLTLENKLFLEQAIQRLHLSARAYHRILRVARTIADMAKKECIERQHLMEALSYRKLEKQDG